MSFATQCSVRVEAPLSQLIGELSLQPSVTIAARLVRFRDRSLSFSRSFWKCTHKYINECLVHDNGD